MPPMASSVYRSFGSLLGWVAEHDNLYSITPHLQHLSHWQAGVSRANCRRPHRSSRSMPPSQAAPRRYAGAKRWRPTPPAERGRAGTGRADDLRVSWPPRASTDCTLRISDLNIVISSRASAALYLRARAHPITLDRHLGSMALAEPPCPVFASRPFQGTMTGGSTWLRDLPVRTFPQSGTLYLRHQAAPPIWDWVMPPKKRSMRIFFSRGASLSSSGLRDSRYSTRAPDR